MRVTRMLHWAVNCHGTLEETREFYQGLFGLAAADRPDIPGIPGYWLTAGDGQLHLVGAPPDAGDGPGGRGDGPGGPDPTGPHLCLAVADLEEAVGELAAAGLAYERRTSGAGVVQVWVRDPSGATVELQQDAAG
ncbi:MAG: VOC family protein [Mycobacteriales bacterium]